MAARRAGRDIPLFLLRKRFADFNIRTLPCRGHVGGLSEILPGVRVLADEEPRGRVRAVVAVHLPVHEAVRTVKRSRDGMVEAFETREEHLPELAVRDKTRLVVGQRDIVHDAELGLRIRRQRAKKGLRLGPVHRVTGVRDRRLGRTRRDRLAGIHDRIKRAEKVALTEEMIFLTGDGERVIRPSHVLNSVPGLAVSKHHGVGLLEERKDTLLDIRFHAPDPIDRRFSRGKDQTESGKQRVEVLQLAFRQRRFRRQDLVTDERVSHAGRRQAVFRAVLFRNIQQELAFVPLAGADTAPGPVETRFTGRAAEDIRDPFVLALGVLRADIVGLLHQRSHVLRENIPECRGDRFQIGYDLAVHTRKGDAEPAAEDRGVSTEPGQRARIKTEFRGHVRRLRVAFQIKLLGPALRRDRLALDPGINFSGDQDHGALVLFAHTGEDQVFRQEGLRGKKRRAARILREPRVARAIREPGPLKDPEARERVDRGLTRLVGNLSAFHERDFHDRRNALRHLPERRSIANTRLVGGRHILRDTRLDDLGLRVSEFPDLSALFR
ncbi:MAG: hypothetical protein BWY49_00546 [Candidatus Omnitrophica bacterium ADurb.Bin314]|nr:MAG: hypothetical protein BWY49_00546 [Candidatus Omnitrophica bacterium ADurb.Bin314]